jgi:hypothetical protein
MATNDHLHDYETFYQEIPASDYLRGFDIEIEDHVDDTDSCEGLDANQVSRLTQDTYEQGGGANESKTTPEQEQTLFVEEG